LEPPKHKQLVARRRGLPVGLAPHQHLEPLAQVAGKKGGILLAQVGELVAKRGGSGKVLLLDRRLHFALQPRRLGP